MKRITALAVSVGCLMMILPKLGQAQSQKEFEGKIRLERVVIPDSGAQTSQTYYFTVKLPRIMMEYTEPGSKRKPEKRVKIIVNRDDNSVINMVQRGKSKTAMLRKMDPRRMETMFGGIKVREKRDEKRVKKGADLEFTDSLKTISGFKCERVLVTPINRDHSFQGEAWITDSVNFEYYDLFNMPGIAAPPKESRVYKPGLFLMESYIRDTSDFLIHKAFVEQEEVPESAFEIPGDFQVIDLETMETGYTTPQKEN